MNPADIPNYCSKPQNQETNRTEYRQEQNHPTTTPADVQRGPILDSADQVGLILSNLHNTLNVLHDKIGESASLLLSTSIFEITGYLTEFTAHFKLYNEAALQHLDYLAQTGFEHQREFYEKLRLQYLNECARTQATLVDRKTILLQNT